MEKKWTYTANTHGDKTKLAGSLMANDADQATKLVKQFGFANWVLTDPDGKTIASDQPKEEIPALQPAPVLHAASPVLVPAAPVSPPPPVVRGFATKRRQTVICGDENGCNARMEPMLAKLNGKIVNVAMHPDARGVMRYLFVVEHDIVKEDLK